MCEVFLFFFKERAPGRKCVTFLVTINDKICRWKLEVLLYIACLSLHFDPIYFNLFSVTIRPSSRWYSLLCYVVIGMLLQIRIPQTNFEIFEVKLQFMT